MGDLIGVDLGGTKVSVGLVSGKKIKKFVSEKINPKGSEKEILNQIIRLIRDLFSDKVLAIGVGVPTIVDVKKGIVYETTNIPSWKRVPLKSILEKKFKVPVFVNNDANCFALGEKYFGEGIKYKNLVGLIIGTGCGAGIIINGKLYTGHNCGAGEFGKVEFKNKNFDYYCSGQFFKGEYSISGEELYEKAKRGDKKALKIFEEYGKNLGKALSVIVNSIDPECIILGGSVSKAHKFFWKTMKKSLKESVFKRCYSRLKIKVSEKENIAILGAVSLYYQYFTP